jgi:hypothetical protein
MWVITSCMKSIRYDVQDEFEETRRTLEDIVGLSFVIWRGVKHIVDAFSQCRRKTERAIITKYIDEFDPDLNLKSYLNSHSSSLQVMDGRTRAVTVKEQKRSINKANKNLKVERKLRLKQIKLHNKVGGNEDVPVELEDYDSNPPSPEVRVTKKLLTGGDKTPKILGWSPFESFKQPERLSTLNSLCKKVAQIYEEVHGYLRSLDKYLHQVMMDDTIHYETSYYEAISFMSKCLSAIVKKKSLLTSEDQCALVEMGKILDDELVGVISFY